MKNEVTSNCIQQKSIINQFLKLIKYFSFNFIIISLHYRNFDLQNIDLDFQSIYSDFQNINFHLQSINSDLQSIDFYLQCIHFDLQSIDYYLQSINFELQSINFHLQSINNQLFLRFLLIFSERNSL